MATTPDELDELLRQLDAEIEAATPWLTEYLAGVDAQLRQLADELLPLPWDEAS